MGSGMSRILPGLYLGSQKDSQDRGQLKNNHITHIVSVIEDAQPNNLLKVKTLLFYIKLIKKTYLNLGIY